MVRLVTMSLWRLVCTALLCVEVAAAPARPLLVQNTGNIGLETHGRPPYLPNLYEAGVSDLQAFLSNGSFTSVQLTEAYMARIADVNDELRAVLELNPLALASAATLDLERAGGRVRSPLHGLPILVKDNIVTHTHEGNSTAGSLALLGSVTGYESTMVAKLKAAGAIILGKANMDEWAMARGETLMGWSARGNLTTSPYWPGGGVCGSSGGSAAAAAVGLAAATLGTQTGSSIICPAGRNNVVGLKPTFGRTSRHGVIPISLDADSIGPLARSVQDAALVMQAIAGRDPHDKDSMRQPEVLPDFTRRLHKDSLRGARIGVLRRGFTDDLDFFKRHGWGDKYYKHLYDEVIAAYNDAVEIVRELGAEVIDPLELVNAGTWADGLMKYHTTVLGHGMKVEVNDYLRSLESSSMRSLKDVINFNDAHAELEFPYPNMDQKGLLATENTDGKQNATYLAFRATWHQLAVHDTYRATFERHNLSAILLPTEPYAGAIAASFRAPVISVPLGFLADNTSIPANETRPHNRFPGQPFGLSFLGREWEEVQILGYAYAFEQRTHVRKQRSPYDAAMPRAGIVV